MPSFLKKNETENSKPVKTAGRQRTRRTVEEREDVAKRREALLEKIQMSEEEESTTKRFSGLVVEEDNDDTESMLVEVKEMDDVPVEEDISCMPEIEESVKVEKTPVEFEEAVVTPVEFEEVENTSIELEEADDTFQVETVEETVDVEKVTEDDTEETLLEKIRRTTANFYKDDGSHTVESLHLSCVEGARDVTQENDHLILPTYKVYVNGFEKAWSAINEIRIAKDEKFEIDTGVSMVLPSNTLLVLKGSPDIEMKYGVRIDGDVVIRRQDAMYRITVPMVAVADLAYVSNYTGIVHAYFVPAEGV